MTPRPPLLSIGQHQHFESTNTISVIWYQLRRFEYANWIQYSTLSCFCSRYCNPQLLPTPHTAARSLAEGLGEKREKLGKSGRTRNPPSLSSTHSVD